MLLLDSAKEPTKVGSNASKKRGNSDFGSLAFGSSDFHMRGEESLGQFGSFFLLLLRRIWLLVPARLQLQVEWKEQPNLRHNLHHKEIPRVV